MAEPIDAASVDAALIDEDLVRALLVEQFPDWSSLPLRRAEPDGNDHRTFRLGGAPSEVVRSGIGMPRCATSSLGLGVDDAMWARGRGWALWKGLIMLTNQPPGQAEFGRRVLDELFSEA